MNFLSAFRGHFSRLHCYRFGMKTDNILRLRGVGRNVLLITFKCVCVLDIILVRLKYMTKMTMTVTKSFKR